MIATFKKDNHDINNGAKGETRTLTSYDTGT